MFFGLPKTSSGAHCVWRKIKHTQRLKYVTNALIEGIGEEQKFWLGSNIFAWRERENMVMETNREHFSCFLKNE